MSFPFLCFTPYSFSFLFHFPPPPPLVAGLSLDFIYQVKVSQKTMKKVKFFNKWQVVARPNFPQLCQSNLIGFLHVNLAQFTRSLSFGHFLKDFFHLLELVMKNIFIKRNDVTNGRRSMVRSWPVLSGVGVNGLTINS